MSEATCHSTKPADLFLTMGEVVGASLSIIYCLGIVMSRSTCRIFCFKATEMLTHASTGLLQRVGAPPKNPLKPCLKAQGT